MKTKFKILMACFFIWSANANAQSVPGEIAGTITDEKGEPLIGAAISYERNGATQGTTADLDGHYRLKPLDAGKYDLTYSITGYRKVIQKDVIVNSGQITFLSVKLDPNNTLPPIEITYHPHLFEKDETMITNRWGTEDIKLSMARDPKEFVSQSSQANQRDDGKDINIRGSRSDATQYYVDGIKMIGSFNIPKSAIKEIIVISGGVPAMFGDATGGIVMITTKSYWDH
jgi:Carboxypeptidase regulatory-like domain/TonB-dependent Receptor Plug Domain